LWQSQTAALNATPTPSDSPEVTETIEASPTPDALDQEIDSSINTNIDADFKDIDSDINSL
jgi:hypothetical protein